MPLIPCLNCNPRDDGSVDVDCPYCNGLGKIQTDAATAEHVAQHIASPVNLPPTLERYPVQLVAGVGALYALANDGTAWVRGGTIGGGWYRLDPLPQGEVDRG